MKSMSSLSGLYGNKTKKLHGYTFRVRGVLNFRCKPTVLSPEYGHLTPSKLLQANHVYMNNLSTRVMCELCLNWPRILKIYLLTANQTLYVQSPQLDFLLFIDLD